MQDGELLSIQNISYLLSGGDMQYNAMEVITLTKPEAIRLLQKMADEQRDLNWKKVYEYRDLMNNGSFGFRENSSIGFCKQQKVKNGQHRIMAFLLSDVDTINFTVQND